MLRNANYDNSLLNVEPSLPVELFETRAMSRIDILLARLRPVHPASSHLQVDPSLL